MGTGGDGKTVITVKWSTRYVSVCSDRLDVEVINLETSQVVYPNHFLEGEDGANNFLFNADRLVVAPLECFVT